jgi:dihydroorotate dehydrogenase (NAD+) catalytic subunit
MPRRSVLRISEPDLSLVIAGVKLKNPVIAASGTFGFGTEYEGLLDIASLGGICTKGLNLKPRNGNKGIRLHETPSGLMNSIGLENPGITSFITNELPGLRELGPAVIANLSGESLRDYVQGAQLLDTSSVDMIELNISCPNVKAGGMAFGLDPEIASSVTRQVRKAAPNKPLMVKLSPNAPDLTAVARSCADAGADALSLVNTFKAMAIDIYERKPVFDNTSAGLSGPCIRPIALRMVWEIYAAVNIPIIGIGGIAQAADALEFLLAGAAAVQVGCATFAHPQLMNEVIAGIREYMKEKNFTKLSQVSIRR